MIKLIIGNKGAGKTKKLIDLVNSCVENSDGNVVCVEKEPKLTYDVPVSVQETMMLLIFLLMQHSKLSAEIIQSFRFSLKCFQSFQKQQM